MGDNKFEAMEILFVYNFLRINSTVNYFTYESCTWVKAAHWRISRPCAAGMKFHYYFDIL